MTLFITDMLAGKDTHMSQRVTIVSADQRKAGYGSNPCYLLENFGAVGFIWEFD
jgi:hypothetical protein